MTAMKYLAKNKKVYTWNSLPFIKNYEQLLPHTEEGGDPQIANQAIEQHQKNATNEINQN